MTQSLLRPLRSERGSMAVIAATVALSVGIATGLFGYFCSFLFPRLAAPAAERIGVLRQITPDETLRSASSAELEAVLASGAFEMVAANAAVNATVDAGATHTFAWGQLVSSDFFALFGGHAAAGRLLRPDDDRPGAPPVAVLGHRLWRTAFGADPGAVGATVRFNREVTTVVGIAARDFEGVGYASEFFVPARLGDALTGVERSTNPEERWLSVRGRVRPGPQGWAQARTALAAGFTALDATTPLPGGEKRMPLLLAEGRFDPESTADPFFHASRLLAGAGILFVLLGAANLAGLLLARAAGRDREWAMRKALGASPARLTGAVVGGLLAPGLLGLGGALAVAKAIERWIESTLNTPMSGLGPGWTSETRQVFDLDARGIGFAVLATLIALCVAAAPPLLRVLRRDPNRALRADSAGGGIDGAALTARRALVAGQIALAVTLLVGSGLLARSLGAAAATSTGFEPRGLAFATMNLPRAAGGATADVATQLSLLERTRGLTGVANATLALVAPLSSFSRAIDAAPAEAPTAWAAVSYNIVGPEYFATLGVPILAGRPIDERDAPGAPAAVVVSAALGTKVWGNEPAVGRRLRVGGPVRGGEAGPEFEVVGVCADAAFAVPLETHPEMLFFAYGQRRHARMTLMVRARTALAALDPALRSTVAAARPDASLVDLVAAEEQLRRTLHPLRLYATVAGGLALIGLLTSLLGLSTLQLHSVQSRRRGFAVRMALGADGRDIAGLVLREAGRLAAWGIAAGMAGAAVVVRLLSSVLYGVSPFDPWTFAAVPLALAATTLLAGWLPARRAVRVDPAANLRST